ncbi:MAG: LysE family translocator [Pseudomonadota bacterium]
MALDYWLALVVANTILLATPGPTMLLIMGTGIERGSRAGLVTAAGGIAGACTALGLSLIGIGALLSASSTAFTVLKLVGAAYLVFLGWRAWTAPPPVLATVSAPPMAVGWLVARGFVTAIFNPKAIVFYVAFVPQFVDPSRAVGPQLTVILLTFAVQGLVMDGAVALVAGRVRRTLVTPAAGRLVNRLAACCLIGAGLLTLTLRRTS